jgi:hypothetical protein
MKPEDRRTIITYRLERSEESLRAARLLYENSMLIPAISGVSFFGIIARDQL